MIMRGRTLGQDTSDANVLEAALATLTAQAAFRLRQQRQVCRRIALTLETSRHKPGFVRSHPELKLDRPVSDTGELISLLFTLLTDVFKSGKPYHRLNIHLLDLQSQDELQADIFGALNPVAFDRKLSRMSALDALNHKFGRGTLRYAAEKLSDAWTPIHQTRSPRYVSSWAELPRIRAEHR
jgi:DNA polymerase V